MIPWSRIYNGLLTVALLVAIAYKADTKKATAKTQPQLSAEPSQINLFIPPLVDPRIGETCGYVHQGLEACLSERFNRCREEGNAADACRNLDSLKECYDIHNAMLIRMAENLCQEHMDPNDPCQPRVAPAPADPCDPSPANSGESVLDLLAGLRNKRRLLTEAPHPSQFKFDR